ncbi:glycine zipper 2TM domain-containing protein [Ralstonia nicotianae]|uniref:glycine zipper 2TM domain-containing protein n=1 Tax=Ralstonia pseudosolanacearum TaxID=1310165 RepID=UPI00366B3545
MPECAGALLFCDPSVVCGQDPVGSVPYRSRSVIALGRSSYIAASMREDSTASGTRPTRLPPYRHLSSERGSWFPRHSRDTYLLPQGWPDGLYAVHGLYRKFKSRFDVLRNKMLEGAIETEVHKMRNARIAGLCGAMLLIATLTSGCAGMSRRGADTAIGAGVGGVAGAALTGGSAAGTVGGAAVGGVVGNQIGK